MSESLTVGLLLALAGGMLDAYSFINRGEVFATAETGNIVQLSVHLSMGEWASAFQYLLPILAFILGVVAAEAIRRRAEGRTGRLQWQQYMLLAECGVLAAVSLLPQGPLDPLANILISFTSAVQVDSFRKFRGCAGSTTMCTGNLRSGTELPSTDRNCFRTGFEFELCHAAIISSFSHSPTSGTKTRLSASYSLSVK